MFEELFDQLSEKPDNEMHVMRGLIDTKPVIKRLKNTYLSLVDSGILGATPLKAHTVITGFPRGGTTLLQAIISACVKNSISYNHETYGLLDAAFSFRNHEYMITKRPNDIYWIDEIRSYYKSRKPNVNFVLLLRDPRSVLSSKHYSSLSSYYVSTERWLNIYNAFVDQSSQPDALILRYEDLVSSPDDIQQKLLEFTGWQFEHDISEYHLHLSEKFDDRAMHGVRPLDSASLQKWKDISNSNRIKSLIAKIPNLTEKLVRMGYEKNSNWEADYL